MKNKVILLLVFLGFLSFLTTNAQTNMNRYITLNVIKGSFIQLDIYGDAPNTPIKIVSGSKTTDMTINNSWTNFFNFYSNDTIVTIYGNVKRFDCSENSNKIFGLKASNNTALVSLLCCNNNISNLNVSGLNSLEYLDCNSNQLSSLNLGDLTSLKSLHCNSNQLSELNISDLMSLTEIYCHYNDISSIKLMRLNSLTFLSCNSNKIEDLKIMNCANLRTIYCEDNKLSVCGLDSLFSQLPYCTEDDEGILRIKFDDEINPGWEHCRDTVATNRHWKVRDNTSVITNNSYSCHYFTIGIKDINYKEETCLYPNPIDNILTIDSPQEIEKIEVFDILGNQILNTKKNNIGKMSLDCSNWQKGIYIIKLINKDTFEMHKVLKR